jgi:hypothetical protein
MKKNMLPNTTIVLAASLALCCCAALTGVPQGSVLLGVYEGSFNGKFDSGTIEVKLYQSPTGAKIFTGSFMEGAQFPANFNGQMNDGKMQGSLIGDLDGTVSGELSADGGSMSGTYKINDPPFDHGTWNARKK